MHVVTGAAMSCHEVVVSSASVLSQLMIPDHRTTRGISSRSSTSNSSLVVTQADPDSCQS